MAAPVIQPVERLDELIAQVRSVINSEPEPTVYRLSAAGTLVRRDGRRTAGWPNPHWVVVDVPAGVTCHHKDQLLPDAAVDGWSPLVRARPAIDWET